MANLRDYWVLLVLAGMISFFAGYAADASSSAHRERIRQIQKAKYQARANENTQVVSIEQGKLGLVAKKALDSAFRRAEKALEKRGHKAEAKALMEQYTIQTANLALLNVYDEIGALALGDFEVMFAWLDQAYQKLYQLLGKEIIEGIRLDDIDRLNHAMRVVFFPRDTRWDSSEYKLHFVPFVKVSGYWISMGGCLGLNLFYLTEKLVCAPLSLGIEAGLGLVADPISDLVYKIATKQ